MGKDRIGLGFLRRTDTEKDPLKHDSVMASTKSFSNARIIKTELIYPDPAQPRKKFDDASIKEMMESIKTHGLLQPITVESDNNEKFKIISGERRYRACKAAGKEEIPCIIMSPDDNKDRFAKQLVENIIREDLNPIDKAYALIEYKNMLGENSKWEDVEKALGISETRRKQFIRLLNLPQEIQDRIVLQAKKQEKEQITEVHARALLLLNEQPEKQKELFEQIITDPKNFSSNKALSIARSFRDSQKEEQNISKKLILEYNTKDELKELLLQKLRELETEEV